LLIDDIFSVSFSIKNDIYRIKVHEYVVSEYNQKPGLAAKFPSIPAIPSPEKKYIVKASKNEVEKFQRFLDEDLFYVENILRAKKILKKVPSYPDKCCLALQLLRPDSILICSDDSDIAIMAKELEIKVMYGSELVELLIRKNIISKESVKEWFNKLRKINDYQSSYRKLEERLL
jgi:hypothetical protein